MANKIIAELLVSFPAHISGAGYIGGDTPGGTVTETGSPVSQRLLLMDDAMKCVIAQTFSSPVDGTYRFAGLNPNKKFSVILKMPDGSTYQDQIKGRISPRPY